MMVSNPMIPKLVSLIFVIASLGFGAVALFLATEDLNAYKTWPTVVAVVDEVKVESTGTNKYGAITVELGYFTGFGRRVVWASQYPLGEQRGEKFLRAYAVGTHHKIWLDPDPRPEARLDLGWNLNTLLVPCSCGGICLFLLWPARYYWRFR